MRVLAIQNADRTLLCSLFLNLAIFDNIDNECQQRPNQKQYADIVSIVGSIDDEIEVAQQNQEPTNDKCQSFFWAFFPRGGKIFQCTGQTAEHRSLGCALARFRNVLVSHPQFLLDAFLIYWFATTLARH